MKMDMTMGGMLELKGWHPQKPYAGQPDMADYASEESEDADDIRFVTGVWFWF
jgi:hypothetical protein